MKRLPLLVLAAVLAGLSAGCAPYHAGAAATVGGTRISTSQLRDIVDRGEAAVPASAQQVDRGALQRTTLSQLVELQVLQALADQLGVRVSEQDVDAVISQAAQQGGLQQLQSSAAASGIAAGDLRVYARVAAYQNKILDALPVDQGQLQAAYAAHRADFQSVHVAVIVLGDQGQAQQVFAQAKAAPGSFADLARKYSTDAGSKQRGGDLGFISAGPNLPAEFTDAAFNARDGQVVGPVAVGSVYAIIHVLEHRTQTLAQAEPTLRPQVAQGAFLQRYQAVEARLGVHVNPRFGIWSRTGGRGLGAVQPDSTGDLSVPASPIQAGAPPAGS